MLRKFIVPPKRFLGILIGNILLGIGIGIFKYSNMGNDPFSAMIMSIYQYFPLSYAVFLITFNCFVFIFEGIFGRKYIGFGTLVNWFMLGYVVQYSIEFIEAFLPVLVGFGPRFLAVIIGVILAGLGLSLYQTSNAGVAPFDSLALIVKDYLPVPYFWSRIFFDAICVLIAYFSGGLIGLGTLVCAFGLGPVVSFFNKTVADKVLSDQK